jgi:hypothetical protein
MAQRLTEIDVDEVSLVGKPATRRKFTLLKSEETGMSIEKIIEDIKKLGDDDQAELRKALSPDSDEEWRERLLKALEKDDGDDIPPEILKDDRAVEAVREELQKQRDEIAELKKAREETAKALADEKAARVRKTYIEKAAAYVNLPGVNPDDFGPMLMKMESALTEDEAKKLNEILKASEAGYYAELDEVGSGVDGDGSGVSGTVDGLVQKRLDANPKLTPEQARAEVYKANPQLLERELEAEAEADAQRKRR